MADFQPHEQVRTVRFADGTTELWRVFIDPQSRRGGRPASCGAKPGLRRGIAQLVVGPLPSLPRIAAAAAHAMGLGRTTSMGPK